MVDETRKVDYLCSFRTETVLVRLSRSLEERLMSVGITEIFVAVAVADDTDGSSDNGYYENNGGEDAEDDDSDSEDLLVE